MSLKAAYGASPMATLTESTHDGLVGNERARPLPALYARCNRRIVRPTNVHVRSRQSIAQARPIRRSTRIIVVTALVKVFADMPWLGAIGSPV